MSGPADPRRLVDAVEEADRALVDEDLITENDGSSERSILSPSCAGQRPTTRLPVPAGSGRFRSSPTRPRRCLSSRI